MKYYIHFTYDCFQPEKGRLWYSCTLKAKDYNEAKKKTERCMSGFLNPQLTEITPVEN